MIAQICHRRFFFFFFWLRNSTHLPIISCVCCSSWWSSFFFQVFFFFFHLSMVWSRKSTIQHSYLFAGRIGYLMTVLKITIKNLLAMDQFDMVFCSVNLNEVSWTTHSFNHPLSFTERALVVRIYVCLCTLAGTYYVRSSIV